MEERGGVCTGEGYANRHFEFSGSERSQQGLFESNRSKCDGGRIVFPLVGAGAHVLTITHLGTSLAVILTTQYVFSVFQSKEKYVPREVISLITWVPDSWYDCDIPR